MQSHHDAGANKVFNFPTQIVIKSKQDRESLSDIDFLDYIKKGIIYKIELYLNKQDVTPLQDKISRGHSGIPTYAYGATGRRVAEEYRVYIEGITSVDKLLQVLVEDLKDALSMNEKKTVSNIFGLLAGAVKTSMSGTTTGFGHRLGSSHALASSIASMMCDIFNIDRQAPIDAETMLAQSRSADPLLKSYIQCLEPVVKLELERRQSRVVLKSEAGLGDALIMDYMGRGPGK